MAWAYGRQSQNNLEEETLPGFKELSLNSNDQPKDGKTYAMYHGTTLSAATKIIQNGFKQSKSKDNMLAEGVYVSRDIEKAERYPLEDKKDQVILKVKVNVGKVKKITHQGHPMQKTWHTSGYDTAWVPAHCGMVTSGLEENCVWDPKRINVVGIEKAPYGEKTHLSNLVRTSKKKTKQSKKK